MFFFVVIAVSKALEEIVSPIFSSLRQRVKMYCGKKNRETDFWKSNLGTVTQYIFKQLEKKFLAAPKKASIIQLNELSKPKQIHAQEPLWATYSFYG